MNLWRRLLRFHPPTLRNAPKSSVWSSHLPPPVRTLRFHPPNSPATAETESSNRRGEVAAPNGAFWGVSHGGRMETEQTPPEVHFADTCRVFRQCGGVPQDSFNASAFTASAARLRLQNGLDRVVLESIPTLVYAEVQEHKIGKGALECAICLNEFENDETIRLLTKCDHVFHQECIDVWLDIHVTCPVCRTNYTDFSSADFTPKIPAGNDGASVADAPSQAAEISDPSAADHVLSR
ncbi:E3 ubiquitin-protein ligase ATL6 [Platanthera guangdongensis]|uniref:RING-type E3 ubiquitin transferase n=1 Tax=Platanthera guangdongensis TaxID=2320717 RepID=A0ABR2MLL5_9ASPA